MLALEIVLAVIIAAGVIVAVTSRYHKFNNQAFGKAFFWFGIVCGIFGVSTQYGLTYQIGTQNLFGDSTFYFLLGMLSVLLAVYLNTDKSDRLI